MEHHHVSGDAEGARAMDGMLRDRETRTGWLVR